MSKLLVACVAAVLCAGGAVKAADLAGLTWGEFRLAAESTGKPKSVDTDSKGKELNLSMNLEKLVANADGAKTEASASMEGEFVVEQPHSVPLHSIRIELIGHIVKTEGTTAQLTVNIGEIQKTLDWKAADVKSGMYDEVMTAAVPNGELPAPFPVTASVTVTKPADKGAVLLSLETIKVTIGQSRVAQLSISPPRLDILADAALAK
jgi:hypothetical protein